MTPQPLRLQAYATGLTLSRESRTITGTITVFDTPTTDYRHLVIHEGALQPRLPLSRVKLLRDHDQTDPVGYMATLDSAARVASFKVAEGENGDRALFEASPEVKLRDGLSVGLQVLDTPGAFMYDEADGTYHVYAAELLEVSLCAIPAYADAGVTSVAASWAPAPPATLATPAPSTPKEKETMPPVTLTMEEVEQRIDTINAEATRALEARLASFSAPSGPVGPTWATFGAFMKDLVAGSPEAAEFHQNLAYTGAGTGDASPANTWVSDAIHLIDQRRPILNAFSREPLPGEGMTLEYLQLAANTLQVGKQATEGADLAQGKITLTADSVAVNTYGGYTLLSKQIIDRANAAYTTTAFKAMDLEYARATEAATRTLLAALIAERIAADADLSIPAAATAYDWLDLIIDATEDFDDRSYSLAGAYVSKDMFKKLVRLEDTSGRSLMTVQGQGVNQTGELDLTALEGSLAKVKFRLFPGAAANTIAFYDPLAITTWESPGAPFQLQEETVLNLSTGFSKYGYLAAASQFPDALVPVTITPAP